MANKQGIQFIRNRKKINRINVNNVIEGMTNAEFNSIKQEVNSLESDFNNNPSDNFYIIGKNNFNDLNISYRLKLFPHNNVFNTFIKDWKSPLDYLNSNSIIIDYGVICLGPVLSFNIPNKSYTKSGDIARPLDSAVKYAASYIHTLNEINVKWVSIVDDPRHLNHTAKDLENNNSYRVLKII